MTGRYTAVSDARSSFGLSLLPTGAQTPEQRVPYERQPSESTLNTTYEGATANNAYDGPHDLKANSRSGRETSHDNDQDRLLNNPAALGLETSKPVVETTDVVVLSISLACFAIAAIVVNDDHLAHSLGYNNQIVVVGFMLSIMSLCLTTLIPTFFLHLEARFGRSTLQNFDGLEGLKPLGSKMDWWWRVALMLLFALPLGLSVIYKLRAFADGQSTAKIAANNELYSDLFGMYGPPGMLPLGWNTGINLMFNATAPFQQASSTQGTNLTDADYGKPSLDPPLPSFPQTYGFNTLVVNTSATAMLDAPPPAWVDKVQKTLQPGESVNISATVLATMTRSNSSVDAHRKETFGSSPDFWDFYAARNLPQFTPLFNNYTLGFFTNWHGNTTDQDQSWSFVGFSPQSSADAIENNFTLPTIAFPEVALMFSTSRQYCYGEWTITSGAVLLTDGNCDGERFVEANDPAQLVFKDNVISLSLYYQPMLLEFLAPFATTRNQSKWLEPAMVTTVATMYWSRVAAMNGPGSPHWPGSNEFSYPQRDSPVTDNAHLQYNSTPRIISSRPAVRRSAVLFVVFGIQPVLAILVILGTLTSYHVAISKGFGTVAMLAGIHRDSLGLVEGAGFSGKLVRPVHLNFMVQEGEHGKGRVIYYLDTAERPKRGRVQRGWVYR